MLLLAAMFSRNGGDILEVELPGSQWVGAFNRGVAPLAGDGNAAMLTEDLPDGASGARQAQAKLLELRVMSEEIQDGFGTGDTLEMSGRGITNGEDALNDEGVEARGRLGASSRATMKDGVIVGRGIAEAVAPFLTQARERWVAAA